MSTSREDQEKGEKTFSIDTTSQGKFGKQKIEEDRKTGATKVLPKSLEMMIFSSFFLPFYVLVPPIVRKLLASNIVHLP